MSGQTTLTPNERAKVEQFRAQQAARRRERLACSDCGTEMEHKAVLRPGDCEGRGSEYLFQCPKCKNIETRGQL